MVYSLPVIQECLAELNLKPNEIFGSYILFRQAQPNQVGIFSNTTNEEPEQKLEAIVLNK
ncbi:MAG: hypothetical protein H0U57_02370 [Tatlockia sp.]|nr:hypothetical protein [Tatlockia sp.]